MVTVENTDKEDEYYLVEVYGSLLSSSERKKILKNGGKIDEVGDVKRVGWELSFDRYSKERQEAVLNLFQTESKRDVFYTKIYKADSKAFDAVREREMGPETAKKWLKNELVPLNSYRPIKLNSQFGYTTIFLIPKEGRLPTETRKKASYVRIVRQGIKESFEGHKKKTNLKMLHRAIELSQPEAIRLHNIIDMGLTFSAMIRLFEKGSKQTLRREMVSQVRNIFNASSRNEFTRIHMEFCDWGTRNIRQAERERKGKVITKKGSPARYGQIAKTLDVVLKVAVYYSHLPGCRRSRKITEWLNAAVDTKMMAFLRKHYPKDIKPWPKTVKQVDKHRYKEIQKVVRRFIKEKYSNRILPVHFDDIYWRELNR